MNDWDEISSLMTRYAAGIDTGDFDAVADLFANGHYSAPTGEITVRGRDEVRRAFDDVIRYEDGTPRTHHNISNVVVNVVEGADEATGSCYFTVVQSVGEGTPIETILVGRYVDRYRRAERGWEIADRCVHIDMKGDLSRHLSHDAL